MIKLPEFFNYLEEEFQGAHQEKMMIKVLWKNSRFFFSLENNIKILDNYPFGPNQNFHSDPLHKMHGISKSNYWFSSKIGHNLERS